MKKLPIGIQNLTEIILNGYIYVDKTKYIYRLLQGSYYLLSRPRRFGKSLLVSTLNEIFSGNKELFRDLWIYDKIDWVKHPVIHFDFSKLGYKDIGLTDAISRHLDDIASKFNITLRHSGNALDFNDLITKLAEKQKVVILIDEYDKPIIDYINDIPKAEANREILKFFYSVIKGNDHHIKFVLLTGVSKFSQVSVFSDLNNLNDITFDEKYSTLLGYTDEELHRYFSEHIKNLGERYSKIYTDIEPQIKKWYNGYSWDGSNFVYNPFSILNLFDKNIFDDFWFQTGTPTFLMKLIKNNNFPVIDFENLQVSRQSFNKYDITHIDLYSLLFQTGYLTIKNYDLEQNMFTLSFPNQEVEKSFNIYLLAELKNSSLDIANSLLSSIINALNNNRMDEFIELLKITFSTITYPITGYKENYFHSIFFLIIKFIGFNIQSEVLTNKGRIDAVLKTKTHIYIIEFKIGTAKSALQQIADKEYYRKYQNDNKQLTLVGIGFNIKNRNIGSYKTQEM